MPAKRSFAIGIEGVVDLIIPHEDSRDSKERQQSDDQITLNESHTQRSQRREQTSTHLLADEPLRYSPLDGSPRDYEGGQISAMNTIELKLRNPESQDVSI